MKFRVQVEGNDQINAFLRNLEPNAKKRLRPKLIAWGEKVLGASRPLVPVGETDEFPGALRDSGRLIRPTISATKARLVLSIMYGGPKLSRVIRRGGAYAAAQHENLDYFHDQGQAKYLEVPFLAHAPEVPSLILETAGEI